MAEVTRRRFFNTAGMGFSSIALRAMMFRDDAAQASASVPKAKSVIFLFMVGGTSQMESFDPKPELNKYAGKTIAESPYKDTLASPHLKKNLREVIPGLHQVHPKIFPMQVGHRKYGSSGLELSDWWPHVGSCVDDIAIVRSMWTTDNNHGAQLQFFTGRHSLEGPFPTIGSWIHYGLGSLNDNLPQFVVLGTPLADCCGGAHGHGSHYLGPEHNGIRMNVDPKNPLPFALPGADRFREEQIGEFDLLNKLNKLSEAERPDDPALRARIKSYELAYRMQTAVPELFQLDKETTATQQLYGIDKPNTKTFGQQCLAARRMVEKGVRFIQIFHGSNGGAGAWDAHGGLKAGHSKLCGEVDQPIGGLLKDLKQRGLLKDTLVVWGTEFGRTPGAQGGDGRDHHPYGFSVWLAGGGIKGGVAHGSTDELGFHAVEDRHYVTDLHATILHQLGLDPHKMELPGRKRLEMDFGKPITGIIA